MTDDRIRAPWNEADVAALNAFQRSGRSRPFTCDGDHRLHQTLIAEPDGWHCPDDACDYRQEWAYAAMADPDALTPVTHRATGTAPSELTELRRRLRTAELDLARERQRNALLAERLADEEKLSEALRFELGMMTVTCPIPSPGTDPDGGLCDAAPYVRAVVDVPTRGGWL